MNHPRFRNAQLTRVHDPCGQIGVLFPGLEFDWTAPTVSGAVSTTVKGENRAKGARVTYRVSAHDDRDGTIPVTCSPKSGSRFTTGRTKVICAATDSSANTTEASFTVRVKAGR